MLVIILLLCFGINIRAAAEDNRQETLIVQYPLPYAQNLFLFATKTCNLPKVAELLLGGGLGHNIPPNIIEFTVPRTFETKASWYGNRFRGRLMANGKPFNPNDSTTAAHPFLPIGTVLAVSRANKQIEVVVKDRGTCKHKRQLDLSRAAAQKLGMKNAGVAHVKATILKLGG